MHAKDDRKGVNTSKLSLELRGSTADSTNHDKDNQPDLCLHPDAESILAPAVENPLVAIPQPQNAEHGHETVPESSVQSSTYSVIPEGEKKALLFIAAFATIISPFSSGLFYPAISTLSRDLHKSVSLINLSVSTYQIFQGIAPSVIAGLSERYGRRPPYLLCFTIYICANLGLSLQNNYAALLTLRMLQSTGSSGTMALANGVIGDLTTRGERGKYIAYALMGASLGPALGPIIGGLLTTYLGWRAIFWFLLIFSAVVSLLVATFFRETNRSIVGDGSVPPPRWNMSLLQIRGIGAKFEHPNRASLAPRAKRVNPFSALLIMRDRTSLIQCFYGGLLFAGYLTVTAILTSQLEERYGFNPIQVGLCYLPLAFGSLVSRWTTAKFIDWKFKRDLAKEGIDQVGKGEQQDIENFDLERARIGISFIFIALSCCFIIAYGWCQEYRHLAPSLVALFFLANSISGALITNQALLTDLHSDHTASVGAATNLTRCLLSAAGVAIATPLINAIGLGPFTCLVAGIWIAFSPLYALVYLKGFEWRRARAERKATLQATC